MKPRIFVTQIVAQQALDLLAQYGEVEVNPKPDRFPTKAELIEALKRNDYLLCMNNDTIDAQVIGANPEIKIVANMAVGFNNVDLAAATARKIPVTNTPGILTETTADLAWALLMAVARRIVEADNFVRAGLFKGWRPTLMLGTDLFGKTLGIIGMGRIGQALARRAKGFNMKIIYYNRHPVDKNIETELGAEYLALDKLLRSADFVSIHTPYTAETHHLVGPAELALMRPHAYLINTSRGTVVDEQALVKALQEKRIAGAGLDVFENEPAIEPELLTMSSNTVLLPHIGSGSLETRTNMAMMAAENVIAAIKGERPRNVVNPEIYD